MIERWLSEIEAIRRDTRAVLEGLTPEQANQQPEPGRWSVAQNLVHITTTTKPYLDAMEPTVRAPSNGTVRRGLLASLLVRSMEPPPRMRVKTLRRLEPPETIDVVAALQDFEATHERVAALVRGADETTFRCQRFRSPFASFMKLRLDQGVDMLLAHARRHLWQARQARRAIGVPG